MSIAQYRIFTTSFIIVVVALGVAAFMLSDSRHVAAYQEQKTQEPQE